MSDRSVSSARSSVELFISMVYAAVGNHRVCAGAKWKVPYSLPASKFFRCLTGPVEAARNGLRHQVACLYHCNRQVGPGDRASVLLMPLASSRLPLDEQSDCLLPDPPVVFFFFSFFFCVHPCVHVRVYVLTAHAWQVEYMRYTFTHANVCESTAERSVRVEACLQTFTRFSSYWCREFMCRIYLRVFFAS